MGEKEFLEVVKEKKKEDDDGEIDDGEIDDDDLEEGEVKDFSDRKVRFCFICWFFMKGNCIWGMNCRFIYFGVNDKGNYFLIIKVDFFLFNGVLFFGFYLLMFVNFWGGLVVDEILFLFFLEFLIESVWE